MSSHAKAALFGLLATTAIAGFAHHATAATNDQGVYMVIDPYSTSGYAQLQHAAATPCPATEGATPSSTFCGGVDGVLLRVGWCNFETDHATEGGKWKSCRYILGYSGAAGSRAEQMPLSPTAQFTSSCSQNYDVCTTTGNSTLGNTLAAIVKINANRAATRYLAPLKLSVGLAAGMWTPQMVLNNVGSVDVPASQSASGDSSQTRCMRLPLAWQPAFAADYDAAFDQLVGFTNAQFPGGANIQIVKASAITAFDLEAQMPGMATAVAAPGADPQTPTLMGAPMNCSSTVPGGQTWLSAYQHAPVAGRTFAQAVEYTFGTVVGHQTATLANLGIDAVVSVPTTGNSAFAQVNCGMSGAAACAVSGSTGDWSIYYLTQDVNDLFDSGLAGQAAAAAYQTTRPNARMALAPSQVSVNWTALSPTPLQPSQQITCALNNTAHADDLSLNLDQTPQNISGVGTQIAWQTATGQGDTCTIRQGNAYMTALNNGIVQGAKFLEVETDAAITDFSTCGPDLASASRQLMSSLLTSCHY